MSFASRLKKLGTNWKKAGEREPGTIGAVLPEGRYIARIMDMDLGESKSSGRLQVTTKYEVLEGPETGTPAYSYDGIETEDGLFYFRRKLTQLGVQVPDDISDIEGVIAKLAKSKPVVRIRVKHNNDYVNIYIDRLLGEQSGEVPEEETGPGEVPQDPSDEGSGGEMEVGDSVKVLVKGEEVAVEITEIIDEDSFKAKNPQGKVKLYTTDQLVGTETPQEEETSEEPELDLNPGDNVQVVVKGKKVVVELVEIVDEESFKAKGKDGKVKTYTTDQLIVS